MNAPTISAERILRFARGEDIPGLEYWREVLKDSEYARGDDEPLSAEEIDEVMENFRAQTSTPRLLFTKACQIILFSLVIDIVFSCKATLLVFRNWEELAKEAHIKVLGYYAKTVLGISPSL